MDDHSNMVDRGSVAFYYYKTVSVLTLLRFYIVCWSSKVEYYFKEWTNKALLAL